MSQTPIAFVDVDTVCTHDDLVAEVGSAEALANLVPLSLNGDTKQARQLAYDEVIKVLRRRTPPIFEGDLQEFTELRDAVKYQALARLYLMALSTAGDQDVYKYKHERYRQLAQDELDAMVLRVGPSSQVGGVMSIALERR